jgi:hypothetical protein
MTPSIWPRRIGLAAACCLAAGLVGARTGALRRAPAQDSAAPAPVAVPLPTRAPKGAIALFAGRSDDMQQNWYKRYGTDPAHWTVDTSGAALAKGGDITSKQEFGDCYMHVEFRPLVDAAGKTVGHGNSGVGLQGRYEVQIMDSFGQKPEEHQCASLYSQKAPLVNACKKAGEWQSFDIIFRAPRFDAAGQVTEKPRATVFQNGILVQNNEEFTGMTGIQYGQYKEMTKTGPIVLQGDHDPVEFRNVWIVPM